MTRRAKLLIGAALAVIGTGSLVMAAPGDQQRGEGARGGGAPMIAQMFKSLDTDGDGAVSREELDAAGPSAAFAQADANGDGALEGDELTAFRDAQEAAREARRQQMMIARFDADEDGKLSLEELQKGGRGGPERIFARLDTDSDGSVSAEELEALDRMGPRMGEREHRREGRMGQHGHHGPKGERGARMHRDHGPRDQRPGPMTPPEQGDEAPMVKPLPEQPQD